jgi:hypothetical protein
MEKPIEINKQYVLPTFIQTLSYKKIVNSFSTKYKKHDMWFTKLNFVNKIEHICLLEEGVDNIIKNDKSEQQKDYIIIKVYLKPEN